MPDNATPQRPAFGILLMIAGMMIVPGLDICAKLLSENHDVIQVTWSRFAFSLAWLIPAILIRREHWWRFPKHPWTQILRGLCLLGATLFFFIAIQTNPIPNALGLVFISPLVVTLLSPIVLGETFGIRRFIATIVGFLGVLVVLKPESSDFQPSLLFAMLAGFSYALYILITRKVSTSSSPIMTLTYTALVGAMVLTPALPAIWIWPDQNALWIMIIMGFVATSAHFLIILSCHYASASQVAPFNYAEIIGATWLSYLFFDYLADTRTWIGIVIICASGIYIWMRELQQREK
jgi:drug/metabolite transporter (DMT)-like permease